MTVYPTNTLQLDRGGSLGDRLECRSGQLHSTQKYHNHNRHSLHRFPRTHRSRNRRSLELVPCQTQKFPYNRNLPGTNDSNYFLAYDVRLSDSLLVAGFFPIAIRLLSAAIAKSAIVASLGRRLQTAGGRAATLLAKAASRSRPSQTASKIALHAKPDGRSKNLCEEKASADKP